MPLLDDDTLLVASSDLTHYFPYDKAKSLDTTLRRTICSLNGDWLEQEEAVVGKSLACGKLPILTVMHVARKRAGRPGCWTIATAATRRATSAGGRLLGHCLLRAGRKADAPRAAARRAATEFTAAERKLLLELARKSVVAAAAGKGRRGLAAGPADAYWPSPRVFRHADQEGRNCGVASAPSFPASRSTRR